MEQQPLNRSEAKPLAASQPLHRSDADDDDENVKQLDECSSLYLLMQECVVRTNRNWKECQTARIDVYFTSGSQFLRVRFTNKIMYGAEVSEARVTHV